MEYTKLEVEGLEVDEVVPIIVTDLAGEEVFRLNLDGSIKYMGRLVQGDDELRAAVKTMLRYMSAPTTVETLHGCQGTNDVN